MFKPEYKDIQSYMNTPYVNLKSSLHLSSDMDLMYQLYSKYLSISKQQITLQQLLIIKDTQTLLQSIEQSSNKINITGINVNKNKDTTSTVDSFSIDQDLENSSIMYDFTTIQRRSNKKITRKGARNTKLNINTNDTNNDQIYQILRQIQLNCSEKTYDKIKNIINQHRKNSNKYIEIQNKQKKMNKIQQNSDKYQQQNLLLKAQLQELQNKLKSKDQQIKQFKQKLNQFKIQKKQNIFPISSLKQIKQSQQFQLNKHYSQKQLLLYINEKQNISIKRLKKIQQMQKNIQKRLSSTIQQNYLMNQNKKSYEIVSNLKQSLLDYREYLQIQATEYDKLFNILKKQVQRSIGQLSQHKIPGNNN